MSLPDSLPPAVLLMQKCGLTPDPWQLDILENRYQQVLLNCCRQSGKSTTVAMLGLAEAIFSRTPSLIALVSRSHFQSRELFKIAVRLYRQLGCPLKRRLNVNELELTNDSRMVCVPCQEETIRGISGVTTLIIDEAARVPHQVYVSVLPMIAATHGRIICLSTPQGKEGFFYERWTKGGNDWHRVKITADQVTRFDPKQLEEHRRAMGEAEFNQEYMCEFDSVQGLVYPAFDRCLVKEVPDYVFVDPTPDELLKNPGLAQRPSAVQCRRRRGGVDFGFRSPFAALWGTLDPDGVLWLTGEHYQAETLISEHARRMPRDVEWYADPSGADRIAEFRAASFKMIGSNNRRGYGIEAVKRRLTNLTLRVLEGRCPKLLREAELYRWSTTTENNSSERTEDEGDHALDALRYLIAFIDRGKLARPNKHSPEPEPQSMGGQSPTEAPDHPQQPTQKPIPPNPFGQLPNLWRKWNEGIPD